MLTSPIRTEFLKYSNYCVLCGVYGLLGLMGGGLFGGDPFGFNMFGDVHDPFSLAGPRLFAATAQPQTV